MRRFFWAAAAAAVVVGATPALSSAQFGGGPGVPAVPQPAVPGAAAAGVGAAGPRVGFFQRVKQNVGNCVQNLLGSPLGQLLNNATKPLSALTGGVIPTLEGKPTAEDTKQPGVAGPAAQGKKDAAEAAKRRADVKYLGTLDCRYYPEASKALADALRTDPSECVRYEAALALSRGCCCNQTTIAALTASVSGYESDGNPGERSARVRCTAAVALEKCLACHVQYGSPDDLKPDEDCPKKKAEPKKEGEQPKDGEKGEDKKDAKQAACGPCGPPTAKQIDRAKAVLAAFVETYSTTAAVYGQPLASGSRASTGILEAGSVQAKAPAPIYSPAPVPAPVVARVPAAPPVKMAEAPAPAPTVSRVRFKQDEVDATKPAVTGPAVVPAVEAAPVPLTTEPKKLAVDPPAAKPATDSVDAKAVEGLVHRVLLSESTADQHAAIRQLVKYDWAAHPMVASCLVAGAKSTAHSAVRVDCIRHLAHHGMSHKDVLAALDDLSADTDSWVRDEAAKACEVLKK